MNARHRVIAICAVVALAGAGVSLAQEDNVLQRYDLALENLQFAIDSVPGDGVQARDELERAEGPAARHFDFRGQPGRVELKQFSRECLIDRPNHRHPLARQRQQREHAVAPEPLPRDAAVRPLA